MNSLHRHTPRTLGAMLAATAVAALLCQATPARAGVTSVLADNAASISLASQSEYMSVGQFYGLGKDNKHYAASGVIISTGTTSWVLTAAHVVSGMASLNFYYGDTGGDWSSFATRSNFVSTTSWVAHPNWTGNLNSGYDIALVRFNANLTDLCFARALLCPAAQRYSGSGDTGTIGTAVGFGMTGTGALGATIFDGLKRAGNSMIDAVAITPGKGGNRILLTDFDSGDAIDNSYGSATPVYLEGMVAPGDSGGGLFIDINGTDFLVGITSFAWGRLDGKADSDFGDVAGFTRVSAFNSWIDSVIGGGGGGGGGGPKPRGTALEVELGANLRALNSAAPIPEPASLALLGAGLFALSLLRRRR